MIIDDRAHRYLLIVLEKASGKFFSNLVEFLVSTDANEAGKVIEKATELVETDVPKTYRKEVRSALAVLATSREWWHALDSPPEWLARVAYLYFVDETLGSRVGVRLAYERYLSPEKLSECMPLYVLKGLDRVALLKPTPDELSNVMSGEATSVDIDVVKTLLRETVRRNVRVNADTMAVELFGKPVYYDADSFVTLLRFLGMHDKLREHITRTVFNEFVPELAKSLGLREGDAKVEPRFGAQWTEDVVVVVSLSPSFVASRYPQLKDVLESLEVYLSLVEGSLNVKRATFKVTATVRSRHVFDVEYPSTQPTTLPQYARVLPTELDRVMTDVAKVVEEIKEINRLSEQVHLSEMVTDLRVSSQPTYNIHYKLYGKLPDGVEVVTECVSQVSSGKRILRSELRFPLNRKLLKAVQVEDLQRYLVARGIKATNAYANPKDPSRGCLVLEIASTNIEDVQKDISATAIAVNEYLEELENTIKARNKFSDEHAVAAYIYAHFVGSDTVPSAFGKTFNEVLMRVGRVLSKVSPEKHSEIKEVLRRARSNKGGYTLLDAFNNVMQALFDGRYISIGTGGRVLINGVPLAELLQECGKVSQPDANTIETHTLLKLVWVTKGRALAELVQQTGMVPDKIAEALLDSTLLVNDWFISTPVAGKPMIAYLSDRIKEKLADKLSPLDSITLLTTPAYREHVEPIKGKLLEKVLRSPPGVVTAYAYRAMPELFSGVEVRETKNLNHYDYVLDCGKWFCQVGKIGREKHVFILYRKDAKVGVAFVARNLAEALEKAEEQYDEGLKVVNLIKASIPALAEWGLSYNEHEVTSPEVVLPYLYSAKDGKRYYITPSGGMRLLDMIREQKEEEQVATDA